MIDKVIPSKIKGQSQFEAIKNTIPDKFNKDYKNVFNIIKSDRDKLRLNSIRLQNTMFGAYFNTS